MVAVVAANLPKTIDAVRSRCVLFALLLLTAARAFAGSATLAWDAVSSPVLAGYVVYYGPMTGGVYTSKIDVGNTTIRTVSGLIDGETYRFAVTAYDTSYSESGFSNEVSTTIPFSAPAPPITSPSPAPNPIYEGYQDVSDCVALQGWAWDQSRADTPISVDVYSDGVYLMSVSANTFRADLIMAAKGNGVHAFQLPTPASIKDGQLHILTIRYGGTSMDLYNTSKPLFCSPAVEVAPQFEGYHDIADCARIVGWAWDANEPDVPISVDIYTDGAFFARWRADILRPDVRDAGKGNGVHGFDIATPATLKNGEPHSVTVRYGGTAQDLYSTSKILTCSP